MNAFLVSTKSEEHNYKGSSSTASYVEQELLSHFLFFFFFPQLS